MAEFDFQAAFDGVHDKLDDVRNRQARTETQMESLVGNGQPGKIQHLEDQLDSLTEWKHKSAGYLAALSTGIAALGIAGHFVIDLFKAKH